MNCFFFNDTATTEIYTLSLHDALPISLRPGAPPYRRLRRGARCGENASGADGSDRRRGPGGPAGQEIGRAHVELQSRQYLVCRLLLEKKNNIYNYHNLLIIGPLHYTLL